MNKFKSDYPMRLFRHLSLPIILASIVLLTFSACRNDDKVIVQPFKTVKDFDSKVVQDWQDLFLQIERYAAVYRPCPAARMLGYVGLATYEASVAGMPEYQSIATRYPGLQIPQVEQGKEYHWPTVVNSVYATMFKKFFANVRTNDLLKIASLESSVNTEFASTIQSDVIRRSKDFGVTVANSVWDYSATDKEGHDKYLEARPASYAPPTGPGKWKPTAPGNEIAMFPYWGKVRTFAIREEDKLARPPLAYSEDKTSYYYTQALEVYAATTPQSNENRWIAEFWSDDVLGFTFSPPSRWVAIANQAMVLENSSLEKGVMAAVKVGIALNDASVSCWNSKFYYNVERPVSYITKFINPSWAVEPLTSTGFLKSTPSFPAYPSGHSTFGAAAAEALTSVFGTNMAMTDRCHEGRTDFNGKPRSFNNFYEMAEENAYSRIWLGVHWRMDCEEGVRLGYLVGRRVNALPFKK
jgi:membrane-associated phospholipid phosphatase